MERIEVRKVSGGKLLKVRIKEEKGIIKEARISGDFFIHPEEALEEIERCLIGIPLGRSREALKKFVSGREVRIIGFDLEDLADIVEGWREDV
ncbi:MAG: lipoate protein ligase C-terminal domain-containing protein [Candidatus Methanomethylicaceae archaeon]